MKDILSITNDLNEERTRYYKCHSRCWSAEEMIAKSKEWRMIFTYRECINIFLLNIDILISSMLILKDLYVKLVIILSHIIIVLKFILRLFIDNFQKPMIDLMRWKQIYLLELHTWIHLIHFLILTSKSIDNNYIIYWRFW